MNENRVYNNNTEVDFMEAANEIVSTDAMYQDNASWYYITQFEVMTIDLRRNEERHPHIQSHFLLDSYYKSASSELIQGP